MNDLEQRRRRARKAALIQSIVFVVVAAIAQQVFALWGRTGDCASKQIDGQCGMSTAFGEIFGWVAAGVIVLAGFVGIFIVWDKKRDRERW
jgi:hypothetical protein